uniref:Uncharacterized protein n=1 Tax=Arundo donax TaxID=35708 RepID=A0A0A9GTU9_ARUDO
MTIFQVEAWMKCYMVKCHFCLSTYFIDFISISLF